VFHWYCFAEADYDFVECSHLLVLTFAIHFKA
jgi:hypothetical protein